MCKIKTLDGTPLRNDSAGRTAFVVEACKYAADNVQAGSYFRFTGNAKTGYKVTENENEGILFHVSVNSDTELFIERCDTNLNMSFAKKQAGEKTTRTKRTTNNETSANQSAQSDKASAVDNSTTDSTNAATNENKTANNNIPANVQEVANNVAAQLAAIMQAQSNNNTAKVDEAQVRAIVQEEINKAHTTKVVINNAPAIEIDGKLHYMFNAVLFALKQNMIPFIFGPAGTGKNVLAEQVAKALNLNFYYAGTLQQKYELEGFIDAGGNFHETQLYQAMRNGGLFMFDEIDGTAAEVLVAFNAVLANRYYTFPTGETIHAHKDFRVIVAGNTNGHGANESYNGRFQLDASTLNRFAPMQLDYDKDIELACARGDVELVDFAHTMREAITKQYLTYTFSTRDIDRVAVFVAGGFAIVDALKYACVAGWNENDIKLLQANVQGENKYIKAFKKL